MSPQSQARQESAPPEDPHEWRPQKPLPTRVPDAIRDPILEPLWSGTRVILHFEAGETSFDGIESEPRLLLFDSDGEEVEASEPAVVLELKTAINARDAVIDGILTTQATRSGEGTSVVTESRLSVGGAVKGVFIGSRDGTQAGTSLDIKRPDADPNPVVAFVAFDLLRVDGQSLLDVPLLERKRVLEGVIIESERVRLSVYTRPPVDAWVASWKAAGMEGAMMKGANGRYVPGGLCADWRPITQLAAKR